jgi:hypothetical protein
MSDGIAMAVKIRSTVMETANSTMLKPAMRLRRVRDGMALLNKIVVLNSNVKQRCSPLGRLRDLNDAVAMPGQPDATATKHSTFLS